MSDNIKSGLKVVYVLSVGIDCNDKNVYQLLLSENIDDVWAEDWGETPAAICHNMKPDKEMYEYVKEIKTDIKFNLAQNNTQYSMQDARDGIIALAYEDLNGYDEYPEPLRIVIHFGDCIEDVDNMLSQREIKTKFIE